MVKLFANDTISQAYSDELKRMHENPRWGTTGFKYSGLAVDDVLRTRGYINTALDYGCGKGELSIHIPRLDWTNYDPNVPQFSTRPDGQFDLVTCTDVMEHVEKDYVPNVIKDLGRYTGKCLFVDIACYPTGKVFSEGPYKGQDVHITVRNPEWWKSQFHKYSDLTFLSQTTITKVSRGTEKVRTQLIYER